MNERMTSFVKFQLPALFWAGCIFIASSIPSDKLKWAIFTKMDKAVHFVIFFILGLLVYRGLFTRNSPLHFTFKKVWIMLAIVVGYGIFDELHQGFTPGRHVDIMDLLADTGGGLLAALTAFIFRKRSLQGGEVAGEMKTGR